MRPAFQLAVDDDLLRKNPFEFQMVSVLVNDTATREALNTYTHLKLDDAKEVKS